MGHSHQPPVSPGNIHQRSWDQPRVQATLDGFLDTTTDPKDQARLLAASTKESGAWLNAPPTTSLGLRMDDEVVHIAVGLRLGVPLCHPHTCCHCGILVDKRPPTVSTATKARVTIPIMQPLTTSLSAPWQQHRFPQCWSLQGFAGQMARDPMGLQSSPGSKVVPLSGMLHVPIPLLHRIWTRLQGRQGLLQHWRSEERKQNTLI